MGRLSTISQLSPINSSSNINDILTDSLLVEILQRLHCQSTLRAKSVCKRWFTLISDPCFLPTFIRYHDHHCHFSNPFTLVYDFNYWHHHLTQSLHSKVQAVLSHPCGFHLDFLPWEFHPIWVVASHKDLLVCCDPKITLHGVYYICNPVTKQWRVLPRAPSCHRVADTAIGFIITSFHSYKLVRVPKLDLHPVNNMFEVEVFCSQMGKWSTKSMAIFSSRTFKRTWQFKSDAITFENKLHWLVDSETIFVFDPYEGGQVIDLPFGLNANVAICLGLCQEFLMVSQIAGGCLNRTLVVWKLQDYVTRNWELEYKIGLKEMVFVDHHYFHSFKYYLTAEVLAFHPSNGEILYLRFDNRIVMCNMGRTTIKVVSECLEDSSFSIGTRGVFMLVHPCWPSSIQPLPLANFTIHSGNTSPA